MLDCVAAVADSLIPVRFDIPAVPDQIDLRSLTVLPGFWSPAELLQSLIVAVAVPQTMSCILVIGIASSVLQ